jgi:RNA polymerase sigma-70 factor (ECF subfamily)
MQLRSLMASSERDQVQRFQQGDPGSFDAIYDAYGDRIYRFCFRLSGNAADAEDLTQEVFLAAYQGLHRFAGRSSLATWLYRIAHYRWRRINSARGPETVSLDGELADTVAAPDPTALRMERMSLDSALAMLPPVQSEAFLLVKAEGLKYREAAEVLGIPQGTVQSRVHDAVVRLRELLAESTGQAQDCASGAVRGAGGRKVADEV